MSQKFMKRLYGVTTFRQFVADAFGSLRDLVRSRRSDGIDRAFADRIFLAVTFVNGCRACSYYHSKNALAAGISKAELQELHKGHYDHAPAGELVALLYAEHYAESQGRPSADASQKLFDTYGESSARQILGIIRAIMVGNLYGNIIDALRVRLLGRPVPQSTLFDELTITFGIVLILPWQALKHLFASKSRPSTSSRQR
jgi:AhpD family alkylhydroperoxidase